ncbi:sodium/myo-inositol cotransporter 2-like [Salvelinus fontinalis]|uniref:sodium/myo-inositol cotransporter 2-like n=1 Tax=Salvelinus fontinalis TaxID=8038 RepID=UPI00248523EB|nr:sodium/myo-inositol cotransporter 2-like [Salvelinus fontinalis]
MSLSLSLYSPYSCLSLCTLHTPVSLSVYSPYSCLSLCVYSPYSCLSLCVYSTYSCLSLSLYSPYSCLSLSLCTLHTPVSLSCSPGLRGLMMAVMIAALMSSLTSIFNSSSTIFTMDLWRHVRPRATEWELMLVGRMFVLVLVVVSVLWIPVVQASQGGQLFIYIQSISTYLQPPVSIVFLTGCFWKRTNEKGAFWGLFLGLLVGGVRMALDFIYPSPLCYQEDSRPDVVKHVHYLYFSTMLSMFTLVVVVGVSLATEKPSPEQISRLTWFTRFDKVEKSSGALETVETVTSATETEIEDREQEANRETHLQRKVSSEASVRSQSRLKAALYWLCGMERQKQGDSAPQPPLLLDPASSLEEDPCLSHMVDANLIICLSIAVFIIGYWA